MLIRRFAFAALLTLAGARLGLAQDSLRIAVWVDAFWGMDSPRTADGRRDYLFAADRHSNINVNLMAARFSYTSDRFMVQATPAFGSYMAANYAHEPEGFRYLVDAYGGIRLSKQLWLEAGILPSAMGYESAFSHDQIAYTRSLSAEHSPYYLTGARLRMPVGKYVQLYAYVVNGWQTIVNQPEDGKAGILQVLYDKPSKLQLGASLYLGQEQALDTLQQQTRGYANTFALWQPTEKLSLLGLYDMGWMQQMGSDHTALWHTANITVGYQLAKQLRTSVRAETYLDAEGANLQSVTPNTVGVQLYGGSVGVDYSVDKRAMLRLEGRYLRATDAIFRDKSGTPTDARLMFTCGLSIALGDE